MSLPSNHVLHNYDILNMLVYKTLWGKGKKGEEDGMNLKDNYWQKCQTNKGFWHVPRISRLISPVKSFLVYICEMGVSESISSPQLLLHSLHTKN